MDIQAEFDRAVEASKQKDYHTARTILRDILKEDPRHVDAWILFAHVAQTREHAIHCFERALFLDHDNTYVRQQLTRLRAAGEPAQKQSEPTEHQNLVVTENVRPKALEPQPTANVSLLKNEYDVPKKRKMGALEIILLVILGLAVLILIGVLGVNALHSGGLSSLFTSEPTPSSNVFFGAIYDNVRATNAEDVEWYMSCIHPDSSIYTQTEQLIGDAFATYDLSVEVYGLQIVKQTNKEVRVAFTMVTRKVRGPTFRDNRIQGVFILRPDNGVWKIYDQKVENVEYLD